MYDIIGYVCVPRQGVVLRCGSGQYSHAICVNVDPFILVSPEGDMLWGASGFEPHDFVVTSLVDSKILEVVMKRYSAYKKANNAGVDEEDIKEAEAEQKGPRAITDDECIQVTEIAEKVNGLGLAIMMGVVVKHIKHRMEA